MNFNNTFHSVCIIIHNVLKISFKSSCFCHRSFINNPAFQNGCNRYSRTQLKLFCYVVLDISFRLWDYLQSFLNRNNRSRIYKILKLGKAEFGVWIWMHKHEPMHKKKFCIMHENLDNFEIKNNKIILLLLNRSFPKFDFKKELQI